MRLESSWTGFVAALQVMRPDFPSGRRERNTRQCRRGRRGAKGTTPAVFPRTRSGAGRPRASRASCYERTPPGPDRRGGGLQRGCRRGFARLPGKDPEKRHHVRTPGPFVCVFHLWDALLRQRGVLAGGRGRCGALACPSAVAAASRRWRSAVTAPGEPEASEPIAPGPEDGGRRQPHGGLRQPWHGDQKVSARARPSCARRSGSIAAPMDMT